MIEKPTDIQIKEYELLFQQLRHVENQRSFVFNLYLVISGLTLGYVVKVVAESVDSKIEFDLSLFMFAESIITIIFYLQIRRMTEVIASYDKMILEGRREFFGTRYPFANSGNPYEPQSGFAKILAAIKLHGLDQTMRVLVLFVLVLCIYAQWFLLSSENEAAFPDSILFVFIGISSIGFFAVLLDHLAPVTPG